MGAVGSTTERHTVAYGGHRIDFSVVRRRRKTLEIAVEPDASVVGETHLYLGRQYRLKVVRNGRPGVDMTRGFINVRSREPEKPDVTRRLVEDWYRRQARAKFVERLEASLVRFPDPEAFRPKGLIVRRMEKRWGSLSPSGRLLLNRRLIEAPVDTIDYVIAHELCHMAEPHHGAAFYRLLDRVMPDWAGRKGRLEERMA